jgi:lysophospholipase L1-like esterase
MIQNSNILVFGDSITWGAWDKSGGWVNRLKNYLTDQILNSDFQRYYSLYNLGVSGDTSEDLLERFKSETYARADPGLNNLFIIAIGINDSEYNLTSKQNRISLQQFQNNINTLLDQAKEFNGDAMVLGILPVDESKTNPIPWVGDSAYVNEHAEKYNNVLKEICSNRHLQFIDLYTEFTKRNYQSLLVDGVHPNDQAHEIVFQLIKSQFE